MERSKEKENEQPTAQARWDILSARLTKLETQEAFPALSPIYNHKLNVCCLLNSSQSFCFVLFAFLCVPNSYVLLPQSLNISTFKNFYHYLFPSVSLVLHPPIHP